MRWLLSLALLMFSTLALGQTNYFVDATIGSDSNNGTSATACGAGCGPWLTWNKANTSFVLGAAGATINFADGTYLAAPTFACAGASSGPFCVTRGGTSTQPVIFQCASGLHGNQGHPGTVGKCLLRSSSNVVNQQFLGINNANYLTIQGFDIGGDATHPATTFSAGILMTAKETPNPTGNFVNIQYNYVHDVASTAPPDFPQFPTGCPSEGVIIGNFNNNGTGKIPVGDHIIGNFINNGGVLNQPSCNQFHGIYWTCPQCVIQNNIVANTSATGIKVYPFLCSEVVTNNLVIHNGWWGMLVKDNGSGNCGLDGFTVGQTTVSNNIAAQNGFNSACSGIMLGNGTQGTNLISNSLLLGNLPNDNVNQMDSNAACTSTAVGTAVNTFNGSSAGSPSLANTFVNFQTNGTGDYHLQAGALAATNGTSNCVAGGITPCVPSTDFDQVTRPTGATQSIGPYVLTSAGTPVVSFSPSPLAFGSVPVSTTSTLVDTLKNTGTANLTFSTATISGTNPGDFAIASTTCSSPLAGGASCTYNINFTPAATGARSANLTLNDNASGSPHLLPLTGTGGTPAITLNPTALSFGTIAPSQCSAGLTDTITSSGTVPLTIQGSFTFSNPVFSFAPGGTCSVGQILAPGQSCTAVVKYCPTTSGASSGNMSIPTNAPASPTLLPLTGTGGSTTLTLTPTSAACGNVQVGSSTTCQAFTLTNSGTLAVSGIAISITGTNTSSFSQSNTCPTSLNPSGSCGITVFFNPAAAGNLAATLTVTGTN